MTTCGFWCIFSVRQFYGGPEEGGWWFDDGPLIGLYPESHDLTEEVREDEEEGGYWSPRPENPPFEVESMRIGLLRDGMKEGQLRIEWRPEWARRESWLFQRPHYE